MKKKQNVDSAIILAGGLGQRLRNTIGDLPKPMAPIKGRPFLEYQIDYWIRQGVRRFILSVGYRREVIMKHFGEKYGDARIEYAVEEKPLGTGGGLLLAVKKLGVREPILALNGDTFFEVSLEDLIRFHLGHQSDWTVSLVRAGNRRYMGMEIDQEKRVTSLKSNSDQNGRLVNGGVYLVNSELFFDPAWKQDVHLSLEKDMLPILLEKGARVYGYECQGRFIDIGTPEDYARSSTVLQEQSK